MGKRVNIQRRLLLAVVATLALSAASSAQAARFGFADDAGKYAEDGGAAYFSDLRAAGGTENRITVLWDPDKPLYLADEGFLDRSLPVATAKGIRVVFHVYALGPTAITARPGAAADFAAFLTKLAKAYPQVHEYVVASFVRKSAKSVAAPGFAVIAVGPSG